MKTVVAEVHGRAVAMERDDIDTDAIYPGRFLRLVNLDGLGAHLFADWRDEGRSEVDFMKHSPPPALVVSLNNFGCGSSRENAVWALADYGVKAVVALSFGDIFRSNCVKNGVVAATVSADALAHVVRTLKAAPDAPLRLDVASRSLQLADGSTVPVMLADGHAEQLLSAEDEVDRTLRHDAALRAYEDRVARQQPWLAAMD